MHGFIFVTFCEVIGPLVFFVALSYVKARLSERRRVRLSVRLSVCHTLVVRQNY